MQVPQTEITVRRADGSVLLQRTVPPGDYVLGRAPEVELSFEAELVSRRHARLAINFDQAFIEDLGSSNGTFINGQRVTEITRLWPNQKIQVGAATVELRRLKTMQPEDVSLAPAEVAVLRLLPEELLRERKYAIGKVVAQGGMGAILNAKDAATERTVAMKVMLDASSLDALARFVAEARVTAQLEHPNIVPVHELSVDESGQPYYTMKMVRGITLRKVLELLADGVPETARKYPLPALLTIFQKACDALAFAHSKGVIHRDLKPENLMLDDFGVVLVMDWGLAKVLGKKDAPSGAGDRSSIHTLPPEASGATLAGTIMGTPAFMSPEQARGEVEDLDARSDIYALGAILFQILHLRPPYSGRSAAEIVDKVQRGEVAWPEAKSASAQKLPHLPGASVPDSLLAVCKKALAFEREQRYRTIEELQHDLAAYQTGFATSAEKASAWKQIVLALKRHKAVATSIAAALVVLAAVVVGFTIKVLGERNRAEREAVRANRSLADLKKTAPTLLALGKTESAAQHFDSALEKLDAALALDPGLADAYWQRAWALLGAQRWTDAAAALRLAHERDPRSKDPAALLLAVEQLAAARTDSERWRSEAARAVFRELNSVGAAGPVFAFTSKLQVSVEERRKLVEQRVRAAWGKDGVSVSVHDALVSVRLGGLPIQSLEPLRGLPIDEVIAYGTLIRSLEPLRGMRLRELSIESTSVADLEPLRGMPLESLKVQSTGVHDLSPLSGMPLRVLGVDHLMGIDLSILHGMPLVDLNISDTQTTDIRALRHLPLVKLSISNNRRLVDFSPLLEAPLEILHLEATGVRDLTFLHGKPLRSLSLCDTDFPDLSPLRGLPLESLNLEGAREISDLSPLRGMPLKELYVRNNPKLRDFSPILDLPNLQKLELGDFPEELLPLRNNRTLQIIHADAYPGERNASFRTTADFWRAYDTHYAAGPK